MIPPALRSLHLIDIENLCRTGQPDQTRLAACDALYRSMVPVRSGDLLIVGTGGDPTTRYLVGRTYGGVRVRWSPGPDGAERAITGALADEPDVLGRFGYLVIGSGDNAFTSIANYYAMVGLMVTVVAPPGSLARSLRAVAHRVLVLERPGVRQAADAEPVALSAGPWSAGLAS